MRRVYGDYDRIDAKADALLREYGDEVRILLHRENDERGKQICRLDFAVGEVIVVHVVIQHADVRLQLRELCSGFVQLRLIGGVIGIAQRLQRCADGYARVVDQPDGILQILAPEIGEAREFAVNLGWIVYDHRGADGVRHGIDVVRIEILIQVIGIEIVPVRELALVEREQQVLLARGADRVIARKHDIVFAAAVRLKLQEHFLVACKGGIVDRDAGFFLELRKRRVVEIALPREHVQHLLLLGKACARERQHRQNQKSSDHLFHVAFPP